MGHQLNYFLTPVDLEELEGCIRAKEGVLFLADRTQGPRPKILTAEGWMGSELSLYLTRPDELKKVKMRYVGAQKYWVFEEDRSPLIEYDRCFFDGKVLRRGRLYYKDGAYDEEGKWLEKPEDFKKWARSIFSAAKKTLRHEDGFYFGADALVWMKKSGAQLKRGGLEIG